MSHPKPCEIAAEAASSLATYLDQPDPALQSLQEAVLAAKGTIGAPAARDALRSLLGAEKTLRARRLREFADELGRALAPHGLKIEARILKRTPRKSRREAAVKPAPAPAPAAAKPPATGEGNATPPAESAPAVPHERSGLLSRLRTAQ